MCLTGVGDGQVENGSGRTPVTQEGYPDTRDGNGRDEDGTSGTPTKSPLLRTPLPAPRARPLPPDPSRGDALPGAPTTWTEGVRSDTAHPRPSQLGSDVWSRPGVDGGTSVDRDSPSPTRQGSISTPLTPRLTPPEDESRTSTPPRLDSGRSVGADEARRTVRHRSGTPESPVGRVDSARTHKEWVVGGMGPGPYLCF